MVTDTNSYMKQCLRERWYVLVACVLWAVLILYFIVGVIGDDDALAVALFVSMLPFFIWLGYVKAQASQRFWMDFAKEHGLQYEKKGTIDGEQAAIFRQQWAHSHDISHVIVGTVEGRSARIMQYAYTVGRGKHSTVYVYTIFEFKMKGRFPHIFLNCKRSGWGGPGGSKIPLQGEFADGFDLISPIKYEMEALAIFTEDVMKALAKDDHPHDVEIVDGELLMFREGFISNRKDLEKEFEIAKKLLSLLGEKLDKTSYTKIGDLKDVM